MTGRENCQSWNLTLSLVIIHLVSYILLLIWLVHSSVKEDPTTQQTDEVSMSMESSSSSSAPGKGPVPTSPSKSNYTFLNLFCLLRLFRSFRTSK